MDLNHYYVIIDLVYNHQIGSVDMDRILIKELHEWKTSAIRKPLLLRGARQVGKTHLIRQFGKSFDHFVEINLEKQPALIKIFEMDLDPKRIIKSLSIALDTTILPKKTLFFIDEIQEYPRAIIALRYFYEEMPDLHVIAAGSLVDFAIEQVGVPVGRISFLYVYPLSFIEYLCAMGSTQLALAIICHEPSAPLNEVIHQKALRNLGEYMAIGGMPLAVAQWVKRQDIKSCSQVLAEIKNAYINDFSKYTKKNAVKYVDLLFTKLPSHIGQHFKYSHFASDYRKRELEPALFLLEKAGIVHKAIHSQGHGIPLGGESNDEKFKIFMLDIGLTQNMLGLELKEWFLQPDFALSNKGKITESFVSQELLAYGDPHDKHQLYYWQREERNSQAEVDFLISQSNKIIPIEVKSGHGASLQSIRLFLQTHTQSPYGIRLSSHPYSIVDNIHSYPLYAVAGIVENKERLIRFIHSMTHDENNENKNPYPL